MSHDVLDPVAAAARRREQRFGITLVALGFLALALFTRVGGTAIYVLEARASGTDVALVNLPVTTTVVTLALVTIGLGTAQLLIGFRRATAAVLGVGVLLFVLAFLTWAASGDSLNLVQLLRVTVRQAVPLTFGGLAGVLCERAGVINIAIEGQLLVAALAAAVVASFAGALAGLGAGVAAAVLLALVLAVLAVRYHTDQIIVGVVLIVFASGLTAFLLRGLPNTLNAPRRFTAVELPLLSDIPVIGPVLFAQSPLVYAMFVAVPAVTWLLFRTRWGLRVRATGETPAAVDTVGVSVPRIRTQAVLLGGAFAGVGGAFFTLDSSGQFSADMSAGKGFIALAAMLVGRYHPVGVLAAALVFGFADALATGLALLNVPIPSGALKTAPYVATIVIVAGVVGRIRVPAADGQPYTTE